MKRILALLLTALAVTLSACANGGSTSPPSGQAEGTSSPPAGTPTTGPTKQLTSPGSTAGTSSSRVVSYRTVYRGLPTEAKPGKIALSSKVPPQAILVEVRTGRHEQFDRIVFTFRDAFPGATFLYTARPTTPEGKPVSLGDANGYLTIRFDAATAHDDNGNSTIVRMDPKRVGFSTLRAYEVIDFEGVEGYLGLKVAPDSDEFRTVAVAKQATERTQGGKTQTFYSLVFDVSNA